VDPTGRYNFSDYNDRNFSLAVLQLAVTNRAMLWMGDSTTRESFVSVFCDLKRVLGVENVQVVRNVHMGDERLAHNEVNLTTCRLINSLYASIARHIMGVLSVT
jgi:hypothetical protein